MILSSFSYIKFVYSPFEEYYIVSMTLKKCPRQSYRTTKLEDFHYVKVKVLVTQSCLTLCNPMDCSLSGSSVHGHSPGKNMQWIAIPFFRGSSQPTDWTWVSCTTGKFFTIQASREAPEHSRGTVKALTFFIQNHQFSLGRSIQTWALKRAVISGNVQGWWNYSVYLLW